MRVYECASQIAEVAEDSPKVLLLKKKLRKAEATNSDLESDLLDCKDKLDYCNVVLVSDLLEENWYLRGVVNSLSGAEDQIAEAERQLTARLLGAKEPDLVEEELEAAQKLESEAKTVVAALCQQLQLLESELEGEEEKIARARSEGFFHAQELVLAQDSDVDRELFSIENEVLGNKVVRLRVDGVLFDPSDEGE